MRIIAGIHRGRRLASPSGQSRAIRPTTDRVRESLFSILGDLHGAIVVDGFAGTGAFGCEAISRGAEHVWFFDVSRQAIALVRENLARIGEEDRATVITGAFADRLSLVDRTVDLVFLDPPYGSGEAKTALAAISRSDRVDADTLLVLEQHVDDPLPSPDEASIHDERTYGDTRLVFGHKSAG